MNPRVRMSSAAAFAAAKLNGRQRDGTLAVRARPDHNARDQPARCLHRGCVGATAKQPRLSLCSPATKTVPRNILQVVHLIDMGLAAAPPKTHATKCTPGRSDARWLITVGGRRYLRFHRPGVLVQLLRALTPRQQQLEHLCPLPSPSPPGSPWHASRPPYTRSPH